jgi:hypothetical protein
MDEFWIDIQSAYVGTSVWLADEAGNLLNRCRDRIRQKLPKGKYRCWFGLGGDFIDVDLTKDTIVQELSNIPRRST